MFLCINQNCAISISKASFPMAMNCPVCQNPLYEEIIKSAISKDEQQLISKLPYVIAFPYKRMLEETDGRNKLELLAYTFLNGLKFLGLVVASEYFNSTLKSAKLNEQFRNNLFQPSFGNWNAFLRETTNYLDSENVKLEFPEIKEIYKKIELVKSAKKYKTESQFTDENGQVAWKKSELTAIGLLINFRNRYLGHGAPLSTEEYQSLYFSTYPVLIDFLSEWKSLEGISMIRSEAKESWEMMGAEISLISNDSPIKKSNVCLSHLDGRNLELIPFYVLPKQFTAGASDKVQIQVYEQNTGQRVVFYSPESVKSEASGEILERLKILLEKKEQAEYFTSDQYSIEILLNQIHIYNEKTRSGLIKEKKLLEGIYQPRVDAETELMSWVSAKAGLFMLAAEAGSGKTNLLSHMVTKYENASYSSILIRSIRTEETNIEKEIKEILNVNDDFNLPLFFSEHFTQENPLIILIDGGNEHQEPQVFLDSILKFVSKPLIGSVKIVLSWRISTLNDLPPIDERYKTILYEVGEREDESLEANHAFLLKGLNKIEIEGAWDFYQGHSSKLYRPNFSFRDLLAFDPLLIEELSNPLLLRLFMELYSGKSLPKASKGFINLWELWWKEIQKDHNQSNYLALLANYMISKNSLQVSLDELFDVPQLSDAVKNIQIDSPHQQLIRRGILSQFFQHDTLQVSFTMEASFHYVVSKNLDLDLALKQLENNSIWKESIKYFLWDNAGEKDDLLLFSLIDLEGFPNDLAALALSQRINLFGAEETLNHLFLNESKDDWNVLKEAFTYIKESRPKIAAEFADQILDHCKIGPNEDNRLFVIELLSESTKSKADIFFEQFIQEENLEDVEEITALAKYFTKFGKHKESADLHKKAITLLPLNSNLLGGILEDLTRGHIELLNLTNAWESIIKAELFYKNKLIYTPKVEGRIFNLKGEVKEHQGLFSEALDCYQNAYNLNKANLGPFHRETTRNQVNQGDIQSHLGNYDLALEEYEKTLAINIQFYGETNPNVAKSINRIGHIRNIKGEYDKSLELYEKAISINLNYYGLNHPEIASNYLSLGDILETKGDYDKSLEYYKKALDINLKYYGENHPDIASNYDRIGDIVHAKGDYKSALEYFKKCLGIRLKYYGESHPHIATSFEKIGDILNSSSKYDDALEYFQKALSINLDYFSENHPNVAISYNKIGDVWDMQGEFEKALDYFEKSLIIKINYYGLNHPNITNSYDRIGEVWETKGDYKKALDFFQKSLKIRLQYHGESHPNVANSFSNIGDILNAKGEYDNSLEYFQKALFINTQFYGENHPRSATLINRIGDILNSKGEYEHALEYFEKGLKIHKTYNGENHPNVAASYNRIGDISNSKGDFEKALDYFQKCLDIRIQFYVENHPSIAVSFNKIGDIFYSKGEFDKSQEYFHKALSINLSFYDENHPRVAACYDRIGDVLNARGEYDKALVYYDKCLNTRIIYFGENHPNVAISFSRIGDILNAKGEYDNSIDYFQKALSINLQFYGENHPDVAGSYNRIGDILNTKGEYDSSIDYFQKALSINLQFYGEKHANVANSYHRIGDIFYTTGIYEKAIENFQKVISIELIYYGESHPNLAFSYNSIGDVFNDMGDYEKALIYFEKGLNIVLKYFGENHPNVANSYDRIGGIMNTKGDYDKSINYYNKALAIKIQYFGDSHPNSAISYNLIGEIFENKGDYLNAHFNYTNSLKIFENYFPENHPNVGALKRNVGKALIGMGDLKNAKNMLEDSIAILLQNQVENDAKLARAYLLLAKCLRLQKDIEPAKEIIEKAKEIFETNFGDSHIETANAIFEKGLLLMAISYDIEAQEYFKKCFDVRFSILGAEHKDTIEVQKKLNE